MGGGADIRMPASWWKWFHAGMVLDQKYYNIGSLDIVIDIDCSFKNESDCVITAQRIRICSS
jgi:hypothetical protein